jgi:hypothetical protein
MSVPSFRNGDPKDITVQNLQNDEGIWTIDSQKERNKKLLFNQQFSDAVLLVGPDPASAKSIPVHTVYLMTSSEPFAAMCSETWNKNEPIRITDCEETEMCSLLRWCYTEELVFLSGHLFPVLQLAHKYMVHSLINFVMREFDGLAAINAVTSEWLAAMTCYAFQYDVSDLRTTCLTIIRSDPHTHLTGDHLLAVNETAAFEMIQSAGQDYALAFNWSLRWSEKECQRRGLPVTPVNERQVMDSFINKMPFLSMDTSTFAGEVCNSGILTLDEQLTILRIIVGIDLPSPFPTEEDIECEIIEYIQREWNKVMYTGIHVYLGSIFTKADITVMTDVVILENMSLLVPKFKSNLLFNMRIPIDDCNVRYSISDANGSGGGQAVLMFIQMSAKPAKEIMEAVKIPESDRGLYRIDVKDQEEKFRFIAFEVQADEKMKNILQSYPKERVTVWDQGPARELYNQILGVNTAR